VCSEKTQYYIVNSCFIYVLSMFCRVLPSYEVARITTFLVDLFNCDFGKLPTEFLVHPFWSLFRNHMKSAAKYVVCLNSSKKKNCDSYLRDGLCSSEFGLNGSETDERCYRLLHPEQERVDRKSKIDEQLNNYTDCRSANRRLVDSKCSPLLESACSSRSTRVVKLVRGTMETMQPLLRRLPDTRVIHLVRDPRAVALSRYKFSAGGRGHYSRAASGRTDHLSREASVYCRQVVADIRWRQLLEREFPGRFYTLTYEQLVIDPHGRASDIYRFVAETDSPAEIARNFTFLAEVGNDKVTAKKLATQWQQQLTPDEQRQINKQCTELMKLFPEYSNGEDGDEMPHATKHDRRH